MQGTPVRISALSLAPVKAAIKAKSPPSLPVALSVNLDAGNELALLREALRLSGLNQRRFAELMGVSAPTLSNYLRGAEQVSKVSARAAVTAAMVCGVAVSFPNPARYHGIT